MTASSIRLANDGRLASEQRSRSIGGSTVLVDYQEVAVSHLGPQPLPLAKYLEASASKEMAVDGSAGLNFELAPAANEIYRIERLTIVMVLASSPTLTEFGDIASLGTGLTLQVLDVDDVEIVDLLDGTPIQSNNDLAAVASLSLMEWGASYTLKADIVPVSPIRLEYPEAGAEKLRLRVSDNLSTLTRMRCMAHGRQEHSTT